jgi:ring-1,2-phenylacetyl-CoA epoxidase subunit PaaD
LVSAAAPVVSEGAVRAEATARAWAVLDTVPDPEIPTLSLPELGIVRALNWLDGTLEVVLTPTYSGCPATEVIARSVREALHAAGFDSPRVTHQLAPAWTTDWISAEGRRKMRETGIAPPERVATPGPAEGSPVRPLHFVPRSLACPRCDSRNTERLSAFGSTACKALWRCRACGEPFEHFKPL